MKDSFIVTGGAGFIGTNLVKALNAIGHDKIIIVDNLNHPAKQKNIDSAKFSAFIDKQDFRKMILKDAVEPVKTVFHLGACSSTTQTNADYLFDNNTAYTMDLCRWCVKNGIRFIYASSAATYGDGSLGYSDDPALIPKLKPLNEYGKSKQKFDLWALENNLLDKIAGLKFFNVFGPHEEHKGEMRSVVNKAFDQIKQTGELTLFKSYRPEYKDGMQTRDFIFVRDAVDATLFFHFNQDVSGIFNCGTGIARTWLDLARSVFKAMGMEERIRFIDMPDSLKNQYQYHTQADMRRLRDAGYKKPFTPLEEGVSDYVINYLKNRK